MKKIFLLAALAISFKSFAQVSIGTPTANAAAALDVTSTSKGVLFPRMTEAQRLAMSPLPAAAQGLLIYQTNGSQGFYFNTSSTTTPSWVYLSSGAVDNTPAGTITAYAGSTAPSGWAFCNGTTVSRTTNATLFTIIGTTYGSGDGITTFTLPDLRGRTVFGHDVMGNVAANRLTSSGGIDGTALGASGGAQTQTLSTSNMPAHTHSVNITSTSGGAHTHEYNDAYFAESLTNGVGGNARYGTSASTDNDNSFRFRTSTDTHSTTKDNINTSSNGSHTHSVSGNTESTGSGSALSTVNPGLVLNYIIKL